MASDDTATNQFLAYGDVAATAAKPALMAPANFHPAAEPPPTTGDAPPLSPWFAEPAPDHEAFDEYGDAIEQRLLADIPGYAQITSPAGAFDEFEIRQGYLKNCPLAAILVAMAHVDAHRRQRKRRLPKMIKRIDWKPDRARSRRLHKLPGEVGLKPFRSGSFRSPWVAEIRFPFGEPVSTAPVLFWNTAPGFEDLLYARSSTGVLWPSLIEKAYLDAIMRPRDYEALAADGRVAGDFVVALQTERNDLRGRDFGYDRIASLSGLLVMLDLVGSADEIAPLPATNQQLTTILKRHSKQTTIVGTLSDKEIDEEAAAERRLVGDHYLAVIGFKIVNGVARVKLVDAQGTGPALRDNAIIDLTLAELRAEVGEIVQER